jgi:hypothetical protein
MGATSFPSNSSAVFSINIVTGSKGGGTAATANQLSGVAKATLVTAWSTAGGSGSAAITGLTATTSYWDQVVPFTAGSSWGEWYTPGFEINIPVSTIFAVCCTTSSAGTGTTAFCELVYSE